MGLGFSCVMTQLALMRECLVAFTGNEMVLGVVLGLWLLLMGVGTWLGRSVERSAHPFGLLGIAQVLVAVVPLCQVFLLRALRDVIFTRGATLGITETVISILVLLLPYCLVAGYALTLACALLGQLEGAAGIGRAYLADTLGSIVGGALFGLVFARSLDHIAILVVPALVNLLAAAATVRVHGRRALALAPLCLALGLAALAVLVDMDGLATGLQYRRQHILARANSPYGKLVVLETGGELAFLENGVPTISTRDDQHMEETVHYAMSQRPGADRVLLVSGGISGTAREILKYKVSRVDYVELDPAILTLGRKYLPETLADPRIRVHNGDGRLFVRQTGDKYDIVILDVPDPSSAQLNRFYTAEFLAEIKRALVPGGVVSFGLGRYENFVSPELARVLASADLSLRLSFRTRMALPGSRVFFLASDGPLYADIAARIDQQGIATKLVNRHYLDAVLTPDRMADLGRALSRPATVNRDFSPVLYYYHLRHWMSQFRLVFGPLQMVLLIALAIYLLRLRGGALALFASGFAASSLEIVLLLGYQVLCGSVYHQVCLIVTVFMAGLALGAGWANRRNRAEAFSDRRALGLSAAAIGVYGMLLPLVLSGLAQTASAGPMFLPIKVSIGVLTLILAVAVGVEFPFACRLEFDGTATAASRLYTADFVGAFLGALLASAFLIPLLGVSGTCWLSAGMNLFAGAVVYFRKAA